MTSREENCPDCERLDRRDFLHTVSTTAVAAGTGAALLSPADILSAPTASSVPTAKSAAEVAVAELYRTLNAKQKEAICFDWNHKDKDRGLLRTFISNNWQITPHYVRSDFYNKKQQTIIHDIFRELINPDWYGRITRQLREDSHGRAWGARQSIAIFGTPGSEQFQFVMTGRHMTLRADGNTAQHVAFGGPIFYGHAASGFNEKVGHPGNVYWEQARHANFVYRLLDEKQRKLALVEQRPRESAVAFGGSKATLPGIAVKDLTADQKAELHNVLAKLIEPFRSEDQTEVRRCLEKQGGLEKCSLAFYKDGDLGNDQEWDNWRLEGPSFVWYFRGEPHVHVWVNVASSPDVKLNARG